jgi:hypothetical protein
METIIAMLHSFLAFLLNLLELLVNFLIAALTLVLAFAKQLVGMVN